MRRARDLVNASRVSHAPTVRAVQRLFGYRVHTRFYPSPCRVARR